MSKKKVFNFFFSKQSDFYLKKSVDNRKDLRITFMELSEVKKCYALPSLYASYIIFWKNGIFTYYFQSHFKVLRSRKLDLRQK